MSTRVLGDYILYEGRRVYLNRLPAACLVFDPAGEQVKYDGRKYHVYWDDKPEKKEAATKQWGKVDEELWK